MAPNPPLSERIKTSLMNRCVKSTGQSLDHYATDEHEDFGLQAGIAIENMAKLALLRHHPTLIVEGRDRLFRSLLLVLDKGEDFNIDAHGLRTIAAPEAIERATTIYASLAPYKKSLLLLAEYRNGVAHLGLADVSLVRSVAGDYVRALQLLSRYAGMDDGSLFGERIQLAVALLNDAARGGEVEYAKKRLLAGRRYESMYGHLDYEIVEQAVEPLIRPIERLSEHEAVMCPVCDHPVNVVGDVDYDDWENDDKDEAGEPLGGHRTRRFVLSEAECVVCGLHLSGWAELQAAGIDLTMELADERISASDLITAMQDEVYLEERLREDEDRLDRQLAEELDVESDGPD
jgi:hypothetical protein